MHPKTSEFILCKYSSWYHLLGICSLLESLNSKPECLIFYTGSFFDKRVAPPQALLSHYGKKVYFTDSLAGAISLLEAENPTKSAVTLVNPSRRPIRLSSAIRRLGMSLHIVFVEEGIGTYGGLAQDVRAYARENFRSFGLPYWLRIVFSSAIVMAGNSYFIGACKSNWFLFDRKTLKLNAGVKGHYLTALKYLVADMSIPFIPEGPKSITILVTAPYSELRSLSIKAEKKILDHAQKKVSDGSILVIKPHPIEEVSKYKGCVVIDSSIPLEAYLMFHKERVNGLLMMSSTSAYTSRILFDLPVERLKEFDLYFNTLSWRQKKLILSSSI